MTNQRLRYGIVVLFAIAMAWVEAAVVFYLRLLVDRIQPHQAQPLLPIAGLQETESVREAATLIMLFSVGWLAGRTWRSRLGHVLVAFGIWDIFYYLFLRLICGWPASLLDWDVLFLLPLPWWGPVLAPMLIACLMVAGGTLLSQFDSPEQPLWPKRWYIALNVSGITLALYAFMADALRALPQGKEAIHNFLPATFRWSSFFIALGLMGAPVIDLLRSIRQRRRIYLSATDSITQQIQIGKEPS